MLSSAGVGSGLDVEQIITALMAVEQKPLERLQRDKVVLGADISAIGLVKSALSSVQAEIDKLKKAETFNSYSVSVDNEILTASADSTAVPSKHEIEVNSLAAAHRLVSEPFAKADSGVGIGTLSISVGSESFDVVIDSGNRSLAAIRDTINNAEANTGVTASIVTAEDGARLILQSNLTGISNAIQVSVSDDGDGDDNDTAGLSQLVYQSSGTQNLTQLDAAADAELTIDGFTVSSASNTISDAIQGLNLELTQEGNATITIRRDSATATGASESLGAAMEKLFDVIKELTFIEPQALQQNPDVELPQLQGDVMMVSLERSLRDMLSERIEAFDGKLNSAISAGFEFGNKGEVSFNPSTLKDLIESDVDAVVKFFTDPTDGFAVRLEKFIDTYLGSGGVISSRTDSISDTIDNIDDRIENWQYRLGLIESRYRAQFTALDVLVANLSTTSDFLERQLNSLPKLGSSG